MIKDEFDSADRITFAVTCTAAVLLLRWAGAAPLAVYGLAGAALVALVVVR